MKEWVAVSCVPSGGFCVARVVVCLQFHQALLALPHRHMNLELGKRSRWTVYTDRSCVPNPPFLLPFVAMCYVMFGPGILKAGRNMVPDAILAIVGSFADWGTCVTQGEALAPFYCTLSSCGADYAGDVGAPCKGLSSVFDLGCIAHAVHMIAMGRLALWGEHVESKANIADAGARDAWDMLARLRIQCCQLLCLSLA